MGAGSWIHWVVLGLVMLLLFGRGKFSTMMEDVAKGIKGFKKGLADEDVPPQKLEATPPSPIIEADKQTDKAA